MRRIKNVLDFPIAVTCYLGFATLILVGIPTAILGKFGEATISLGIALGIAFWFLIGVSFCEKKCGTRFDIPIGATMITMWVSGFVFSLPIALRFGIIPAIITELSIGALLFILSLAVSHSPSLPKNENI